MTALAGFALLLAAAPPAASAKVAVPSAAPAPASPAPRSAGVFDFAERLRALGRFDACAVEALRAGYAHPVAQERATELAALCLDLAHRFREARRLLSESFSAQPPSPKARWRLCYTEVFLAGPQSPLCSGDIRVEPDRWLRLSAYTPIMRSIVARRWDAAADDLARLPSVPSDTVEGWAAEDRGFVQRHGQLPYRSPWIAALLSAVIPGAGRAYVGRWGDAAFSFVLVGLPAGFGAWDFARQGSSSVGGWLLVSVAGLFYLGDLYGSAVGAIRFDRQQDDDLAQQVLKTYEGRVSP